MALVEYELNINAAPEDVYRISQDYSVRYLWDPFPEKIELLNGAQDIVKGVKALVIAKNGLTMEVEFVQVAPPTTATVKMTKGPIFISSFAGSWIFKPDSKNATKAKFTYSIKAKKWAIPQIADRIASWYFKRVVKSRLDGLKKYCEQTE